MHNIVKQRVAMKRWPKKSPHSEIKLKKFVIALCVLKGAFSERVCEGDE